MDYSLILFVKKVRIDKYNEKLIIPIFEHKIIQANELLALQGSMEYARTSGAN